MQEHLKQIPTSRIKINTFNFSDPCYCSEKMSKEAEKVINDIKRRDRPSLNLEDWQADTFYQKNLVQHLFECPDQIDRKDTNELTVEEFKKEYLQKKKPVIIKGCPRDWRPQEYWAHQYFQKTFSDNLFKVGEDDDGQKLKTPLKIFLEYLVKNKDDSPLYLFENTNNENDPFSVILQNYKVPLYFKEQENLLGVLQHHQRPPYRWFLMGPERSGSTVHVDPMMTCAWNTSLVGHKRWVLLNPNTPKYIVKGKQFRAQGYKDQAINYFVEILPKIKAKYSEKDLELVEFIQYPGETVFIPSGIWHAVLNLDDTIAVTQNFISYSHFEEGWEAIRDERRYLIPLLLKKLKQQNQQFYEKGIFLNRQRQLSELSESEKDANLQNHLEVDNFHSSDLKEEDLQDQPQSQTRSRVQSESKWVGFRIQIKAYSDDGSDPLKSRRDHI